VTRPTRTRRSLAPTASARAHCGHHGDRPHRDGVVLHGKQEVFLAVVEALDQVGLHPPTLAYLTEPHADAAALLADIAAHHRAYLETYHRNAKMMRVVEEVTNIDATFRRGRTARAQPWIADNRDAVRRLQHEGRADPGLDPVAAARALSTMVSRTAYITFVLEEVGAEAIDGLAETLARLWVDALKLIPRTTCGGKTPRDRRPLEEGTSRRSLRPLSSSFAPAMRAPRRG
jgi:hypothetical protein